MATEVSICNLALARLGDDATVSSIDPPEGSAQAEQCRTFYPLARDSWLEAFTWSFCRARKQLAQVTSESTSYEYAYALPSELLRAIAVIPSDATDDNLSSIREFYPVSYYDAHAYSAEVRAPFHIEALEDGTRVVYTDLEDAILMYTKRVTDTSKFSPLFVNSLSYYLAGMLAGPLISGDRGMKTGQQMDSMAYALVGKAQESDANQSHDRIHHVPNHLNLR